VSSKARVSAVATEALEFSRGVVENSPEELCGAFFTPPSPYSLYSV
jgi:hypothetical protein